MNTTIRELFKDAEYFGWDAIKSKLEHYLDLEKKDIVDAFDEGFGSQISDDNGNVYYEGLFSPTNNPNKQ